MDSTTAPRSSASYLHRGSLSPDRSATRLLVRLADPVYREGTAQELADLLGVERLVLLVRDAVLETLVPAPAMPQTLPGGIAWRQFLAECLRRERDASGEGAVRLAGEIDLGTDDLRPALASIVDGLVAIFVGGEPDVERVTEIEQILPLLAHALHTEHSSGLDRSQAIVAREEASRARNLATSLEAARAEGFRLNARLREEHRRKDDFLAMLAHELRNPLAPVVATLELLRRRGPEPKAFERHLDVMMRQVSQLSRLVEDLLDVARVNRGQIELRRERVLLDDVLAGAVEATRNLVDGRQHELDLRLAVEPLWVHGDPARLTQVFANLLHNAAKYTGHGGRVEIEAKRAEEDARWAVVAVRDNGIGMSQETLENAFSLFSQGPRNEDRAQGGLGLGLTLVRSLVELHGGEVWAHSEGVGEGSTFCVRLPLVTAPATAEVEPEVGEAAGAPSPAGGPGTGLRVLVVDDNEDAARSLAELLRLMGHRTDVAFGGLTALQTALDLQPDLVLLDIGLPDLDGYQVAGRLRRLSGPRVRLVAVTGYGSSEDKQRAAQAGFDEHVTKPVMAPILEDLLSRAVEALQEEESGPD